MNLAFEGVDKAGKTSLIHEFKRRQWVKKGEFWNVVKFSSPVIAKQIHSSWSTTSVGAIMSAEMLSEYFNTFKLMKALALNNLLLDRFFLGEFIYCFIRGYSYSFAEEQYWLDLFIKEARETNTQIVYVKANRDTIIQRMRNDGGDAFLSEERVAKVIEFYESVMTDYQIPHIVIDTEHMMPVEACDKLEILIDPFSGRKDIK